MSSILFLVKIIQKVPLPILEVLRWIKIFRVGWLILFLTACSNMDPTFESLLPSQPHSDQSISLNAQEPSEFTPGSNIESMVTPHRYRVVSSLSSFNGEILSVSQNGYKLYSSSLGVHFSNEGMQK